MRPQAQEHLQPGSWKSGEGASACSLRREGSPAHTLSLDSGLQEGARIHFLF